MAISSDDGSKAAAKTIAMTTGSQTGSQPGSQKRPVAIALALVGAIAPFSLPVAGLHKFYLGQPFWGVIYLLLGWTPIAQVACAIEALWYLTQDDQGFAAKFGGAPTPATGIPEFPLGKAHQVSEIATSLRELEQLRQEGLLSEYEFEQKRRAFLEHLG